MVGGGGRGDVIFNITEGGGLELIFFVLEGVLSKFLLDNSSFSAPPPLLIIIAQSLTGKEVVGAGVVLRVYQMNVVKSLTPKAREKSHDWC